MPCSDGGSSDNSDLYQEVRDLKERNDELARLLCRACRTLEGLGALSGVSKLSEWWAQHKEWDERRRQHNIEIRKRAREEAKRTIAKLKRRWNL